MQQIFGGRCLAPVNIEEVGENGEGEEGYAQRHGNLPDREGGADEGIHILDDKAPVLEKAQQQKICHHCADQGEFGGTGVSVLLLRRNLQAA